MAGKTSWQRFVLQVSALAAAAATIGGVAIGSWKLLSAAVDRIGGSSANTAERNSSGETSQVNNGTDAADTLVELLIDRRERGVPVSLDHQIHFGGIQGNQFTLQYHCDQVGGCSTVTLVDYGVAAAEVTGADDVRWFDGCWTVDRQGLGLDASGLKLTLVRIGKTCPG